MNCEYFFNKLNSIDFQNYYVEIYLENGQKIKTDEFYGVGENVRLIMANESFLTIISNNREYNFKAESVISWNIFPRISFNP